MTNWNDFIESDPDVLLGKPVIKGTRLSVEFIMERLADGWSEDEIIESYPNISKESLNAIYAYVYDFLKDSMIYSIDRKVAQYMLLLADENFPIPSYKYLTDKGFDIVHITNLGLSSVKDERVIDYSIKEKRIIITFDSDFGELIFKSGHQPIGVVFFRWKTFRPTDPGIFLENLIKQGKIELETYLTVVDDKRIRQRKI